MTNKKCNRIKKSKKTKSGLEYCSPSNNHGKEYTCFNKKSLKNIANKWNLNNNTNKINTEVSDYKLWNNIEDKMKSKCGTEWCWINETSSTIDHNDLFKPIKPKSWEKNSREWLDSLNIMDVMKQYEDKYNNFVFIGPVPIDFDLTNNIGNCIVDELCKLNIENLINRNKTKIGIVFNLDTHDKDGSHWVALYCDTKKSEINYFDSYGIEPEDEIKILINRFYNKLNKINGDCVIEINTKRHQYKGTECGVYCLYFLINMLIKKSKFSNFCNRKMPDDFIFKNRNKLFI
jgi:predicted lactoylglutathione lyase